MTPPDLARRLTGRHIAFRNTSVIGPCSSYQTLIAPPPCSNAAALISPPEAAANAAEIAQRPAGFADLVEKVKPAVISVRVKVKAGSEMMSFDGDMPSPPNSQMQRFFHHFGMP